MTWNYRIIKSKWNIKKMSGDEYSIRSVYYDKKGKPTSWQGEPQYLCSETMEGLMGDLILIRQAFKRPILEEHLNTLVEVKDETT